MPGGDTTTAALADSLDTVVSKARVIREYKGVISQLADRVTLGEGIGNTWKEISLSRLTASAITETSQEDNPQQLVDSAITITPSMISVHTVITDRAARNISKKTYARVGELGQNSIERKKDQDGITLLDGATTSLGGAGTTLTSGIISAGSSRVRSNTTEPWMGPVAFVLHGFQKKDLFDEMVAGIGTYPVPNGSTAEVFKQGFTLGIDGATGFTDDNISIDSSDDAKGGIFASGPGGAVVLCQARRPWVKTIRNEKLGGGATEVLHRDEYAYGERGGGVWLFEVYTDALAPTS